MGKHFIIRVPIFCLSILILSLSIDCFADEGHKDKWSTLLKRNPFVYTIPVVSENTPIDGTYVKKAIKEGYYVDFITDKSHIITRDSF